MALLSLAGSLDRDRWRESTLGFGFGGVGFLSSFLGKDLEVEGIVVNQYQPRASLPKRIVEELLADDLPVLETKISASVKMKESHDDAKPLIHLAPSHKLTLQFVELFEELSA